jgi:hypothetical protein
MMKVQPAVEMEVAYLRELRTYGRPAALERITEAARRIETAMDVDYDSLWGGAKDMKMDDEELEREKQQRQEEEAQRLRRELESKQKECPPELEEIMKLVTELKKLHRKVKKEILEFQKKIEFGDHTEQFVNRLERLKAEETAKMNELVLKPLIETSDIRGKLRKLGLESSTYYATQRDVEKLIASATALVNITSLKSYELAMDEAERHEDAARSTEEAAWTAKNMLQYTAGISNDTGSGSVASSATAAAAVTQTSILSAMKYTTDRRRSSASTISEALLIQSSRRRSSVGLSAPLLPISQSSVGSSLPAGFTLNSMEDSHNHSNNNSTPAPFMPQTAGKTQAVVEELNQAVAEIEQEQEELKK